MAPVQRGTATTGGGSSSTAGTTYSISKPTGVVDGDLLVAVSSCDESGTATVLTGPSGWTLVATGSAFQGSVGVLKIWTKIASSEPTSWAWPIGVGSVNTDGLGVVIAWQGGTFDTTTPVANATFGGAASSTSHVAPSVTGVINAILTCVFFCNSGGGTYTPPSGMTELSDAISPGPWTAMETAVLLLSSTSATGTKTATCSTSRPSITASFEVQPSGSTPITLTGTGTGTDALSVTASIPLADTGSGVEALSAGTPKAFSDTGSGSDAITTVAAVVPLPEGGSGVDALTVSALVTLTETGSSTQTLAAGVPIAFADTGTGTDALTTLRLILLADTGTGTDGFIALGPPVIAAGAVTVASSGIGSAVLASSGVGVAILAGSGITAPGDGEAVLASSGVGIATVQT